MIYVNLLVLAFVVCFIIDYSGVIEEMEEAGKKWLKVPFFHIPKPFSCSLCSTFWCGLIYLIIIGGVSMVNIGYVAFLSAMAGNITSLIYFVSGCLNKVIEQLSSWFGL